MKKKALLALLALGMIGTSLVGCQKEDPKSENITVEQQADEEESDGFNINYTDEVTSVTGKVVYIVPISEKTKQLKDGSIIEVNGETGTYEVVNLKKEKDHISFETKSWTGVILGDGVEMEDTVDSVDKKVVIELGSDDGLQVKLHLDKKYDVEKGSIVAYKNLALYEVLEVKDKVLTVKSVEDPTQYIESISGGGEFSFQ